MGSEHNIATTVGNFLFPAGNVRIANDGVVIAGITAGDVSSTNEVIPAAGFPDGHPGGRWVDSSLVGRPLSYAPPDPCNNGACSTIGYVGGPFGNNAPWSLSISHVFAGTVLSIFPPTMALTASSALGPGSLKLDITAGPPSGTYFLAGTLVPGAYPNGWLFGVDISYAELATELAAGFLFTGPLTASGSLSFGPLPGVPPLTLYAIAFGFPPGSPVPSAHTSAISYSIP